MKLPAKPLASGLLFVSGALLLIAALHAPRDGVRPSPMQTWPGTVSASSVGVVVFTAPPKPLMWQVAQVGATMSSGPHSPAGASQFHSSPTAEKMFPCLDSS